VALGEVTDEEATAALAAAGLGRLEDADTAVLDVAALRARVAAEGGDRDEGWAELARSASSDGMIRTTVQSAAGA